MWWFGAFWNWVILIAGLYILWKVVGWIGDWDTKHSGYKNDYEYYTAVKNKQIEKQQEQIKKAEQNK